MMSIVFAVYVPSCGTPKVMPTMVPSEAQMADSDLKNVNDTLYEVKKPGEDIDRWYVVRDLGTALGETGRRGYEPAVA